MDKNKMSRSIKPYYLSSITTSWSLTLLSVLSSALVLVAGSWDRLVGSATLLLVLGAALLSAGLPGHLLHHVPALLPGGGETLPGAGAGALLLVNILGDGRELVLADLVRNLVTHLAGRVDIIADLLGDILTDLTIVSGTLALLDLPGWEPRCTIVWRASDTRPWAPGNTSARAPRCTPAWGSCDIVSRFSRSTGSWGWCRTPPCRQSRTSARGHPGTAVWAHCDTPPWGHHGTPPWELVHTAAQQYSCTPRSSEPSHRLVWSQACTPQRTRCCTPSHTWSRTSSPGQCCTGGGIQSEDK